MLDTSLKSTAGPGSGATKKAAVFGSGPVGVFAQRSAALFGPAAIVAVDLDVRAAGAERRVPRHDDVAERRASSPGQQPAADEAAAHREQTSAAASGSGAA